MKWTHRQYRTTTAWMDEQWNRPGLTEHYLMMVGKEVRGILAKDPNSIKLDHLKLTFDRDGVKKVPKMTREEASQLAMSRWFGFIGRSVPDGG